MTTRSDLHPDHRGHHTEECPHCRDYRQAIKAIREALPGCTLKDAREAVDAFVASGTDRDGERRGQHDYRGCFAPNVNA